MLHKSTFTLEVDFQIKKVSCPGVWLCPHGRLSLEVYMLKNCVQTARIKPFFPLDFNEKYIFQKTFDGSFDQSHLARTLDNECVYIELIQWECDGLYGGVLASFRCALEELLNFSLVENAKCKCNHVELLMQPSKSFPGILAPKIEISTETTVKEGLSFLHTSKSRAPSPSNKVLCQLRQTSSCTSTQRQRPVCHSAIYHKSRKCFPKVQTKRPVFSYRKPDSSLIMRQVQGLGLRKCYCCNEYSSVANILRDRATASADDLMLECGTCEEFKTKPMKKPQIDLPIITPSTYNRKCYDDSSYCPKYRHCFCNDDHMLDSCLVCAKYLYYFDSACCNC